MWQVAINRPTPSISIIATNNTLVSRWNNAVSSFDISGLFTEFQPQTHNDEELNYEREDKARKPQGRLIRLESSHTRAGLPSCYEANYLIHSDHVKTRDCKV